MSLVGTRASLTDRCTIQRNQGTADSWGQKTVSWQTLTANVVCRFWDSTGSEPVDVDRTVAVIDRRLVVPLGTTVTERDRISSVTRRGTELLDGPAHIEAVITHADHLELLLRRAR